MSTFSFHGVFDLVELYGKPLVLLAALMNGYGCSGMKAVVFYFMFLES
jgi:hypothetical protein